MHDDATPVVGDRSCVSRSSRSVDSRTSTAMDRRRFCLVCMMLYGGVALLYETERASAAGEEVVLYITTEAQETATAAKILNKRATGRPKATTRETKTDDVETTRPTRERPVVDRMSGQSHIGDRESQIVVKPTVIVNFRGTVTHRDSDIRLEARRKADENDTAAPMPVNVFNINQEIKLERTTTGVGGERERTENAGVARSGRSFRRNAHAYEVTL